MSAPDDFLYEYAVVRYVPYVHRQEFINIGLIMLCKRRKWISGRIELNEDRVRCFDPRVDITALRRQCLMFERCDVPDADIPVEERYRWLAAAKSATLQVSPSHPGLLRVAGDRDKKEAVEILENEFNRLFRELVLL